MSSHLKHQLVNYQEDDVLGAYVFYTRSKVSYFFSEQKKETIYLLTNFGFIVLMFNQLWLNGICVLGIGFHSGNIIS